MEKISDNIKSILTLIIIFFTYALLILILILCKDQPTIVSQILIAVISGFTGVTGYYYGYSQGASKKDDAQAILTANSKTTVITPDPEKKP